MTDKFALYMMRLGKFQNTMETYTRNIRQYFEWCEFSFGNAPPQLYRANVLEYISYVRNLKGYSPKSVNNHLSALRCLNEFLIDEGIQTETVILKTDFMKVQLQYASPCTVEKRDVDAFRQRLKNSILLYNSKAENRPLMKVIYSLFLLAPSLSALIISCCKYFLINVKLRDTAII